MKLRAFFQALVIVVLLLAGWLILLQSRQKVNPPAIPQGNALLNEEAPTPDGPQPAATDSGNDLLEEVPVLPPPEGWSPWLQYLQAATSNQDLRQRIFALESMLKGLPAGHASAFLEALWQAGVSLPLPLGFQVGTEGRLVGAGDISTFFLNWLGEIDPEKAARIGRTSIGEHGTSLSQEHYVVHLRNATALPGIEKADRDFTLSALEDMLRHEPWLTEPEPALAEAMDALVAFGATSLIPELEPMLRPEAPRMLRHAASLTLERLAEQASPEELGGLLENRMEPVNRADLIARVRPGSPENDAFLETYLTDSTRSPDEVRAFLARFPNLNRSFSHNYFGSSNPTTTPEANEAHLEQALGALDSWLETDALAPFEEELQAARASVVLRLGYTPTP
jgi:hypothetical protein